MREWYARSEEHRFRDLTTRVVDEGDGQALLCLHGFPTSSWDWEPLWPTLRARFRCVAFDLVGLGRASKPDRPLPVALQADLAEDILRARGIEHAHLLAHDLGDTVAQELLARDVAGTARIAWRSCVLLNGGLFPETHRPRPVQRLLISPLGRFVAPFTGPALFARNVRAVFGPETPPSATFLRDSWTLMTSDGGKRALPRLIRYMEERKRYRARWVGALTDTEVPLRLINGNADPVSGRHAAERFGELVREPDIVHLPRLGHYPHVEDPSAVAEALDAFWDRVLG